jgi:hypothetical protein
LEAPERAIKAMAINATLIRKFVIVLAPFAGASVKTLLG